MGYSRLEPGRELEVREYISFQRGRDGFCELIECSVDELLERKAESIEECLRSETARLMLANSEFLILLNQAATDRAELAKLLHISETQMSHVTNVEAGHGLMRIGSSIIPFVNEFPRDGTLYRLMTTKPNEKF